jgi:uncharacterized membrane protein
MPRRKSMSTETTVNKLKKIKFTVIGPIIGASIALIISELGFEVAMSVGYILGLCIGLGIDQRGNKSI